MTVADSLQQTDENTATSLLLLLFQTGKPSLEVAPTTLVTFHL